MDIKDFLIGPRIKESLEIALSTDVFESAFGNFPILFKQPVMLALEKLSGRLHLSGEGNFKLGATCDRCSSDVELNFDISIDRYIPIEDGVLVYSDDEDATCAFDGFDLDGERLIKEEIVEHWPMKVLCREDCKGLCLNCGKNLNDGDCGCDSFVPDPRMAGFLDILNQLDN